MNKQFSKVLTSLLMVCSANSVLAQSNTVSGTDGPITITPLIHSSVQLEYGDTVVQIDPWNRVGLQGAKLADLILITDNVGHHQDVAAIEKLSGPQTPVVMMADGREKWPDGIVIANGEMIRVAGLTVEAVAAYDIIPGEPSHLKGQANGYVLTLGGKRFYFAGVTECVDEVKALKNIDVAFMPLNVPLGRMTPAASAQCTKIISPDVVYLYHYDQDYARRALNPDYADTELPGGISIAQSLDLFDEEMQGSGIEVRRGDFYPPLD
ncbi:MAG: metal-dependent hydrolase [SAR86 cluster bacterium]|uniref:Metal-dependent hydrolase n=1 Tax=SAR86 cluster bacterium TaxID=2030880 RepID=A0A2A4MLC2_9GAMM|nr:MAG: metal-dependent hydrolase [SAR86 cluster bacterium]